MITPYLIAGGTSRRLGRDKRGIVLEGRTLFRRSVDLLEQVTDTPVVVVGDNVDDFAGHHRVLRDAVPGAGPLGGAVAALEDCGTPWALLLAVDLPFLEARDLEALVEQSREMLDGLVLAAEGVVQPLAGLYARAAAAAWRAELEAGRRAMKSALDRIRWQAVAPPGGAHALTNINAPEDIGGWMVEGGMV